MSSIIHRIYTARNILLRNLSSVGYDTTPFENTSFETIQNFFNNKQANLMNLILYKNITQNDTETSIDKENQPPRAFVHFHTSSPLKSTNIYDIIDIYKIQHLMKVQDTILIISTNETNDTITKLLGQIWANETVFITIFHLDHLQYSVLDHKYVPKHIPLSETEKQSVYQQFNIKNDTELPQISRFDPVAKTILLRPGELCKILRPSKTTIFDNHFYRLCC